MATLTRRCGPQRRAARHRVLEPRRVSRPPRPRRVNTRQRRPHPRQPAMPSGHTAQRTRHERIQDHLGRRGRERIFHNCSGKHSAWLAGCVASGWDIETYLDPNHPIQRSVIEIAAEATGANPEPLGVDGCGAPTLRGSVRSLAAGFRTLTTDPDFARIAFAMTRFRRPRRRQPRG